MQYRKLGRTGLKVSAMCLGTMVYGNQVSEIDAINIIGKALKEQTIVVNKARPRTDSRGVGSTVTGGKYLRYFLRSILVWYGVGICYSGIKYDCAEK